MAKCANRSIKILLTLLLSVNDSGILIMMAGIDLFFSCRITEGRLRLVQDLVVHLDKLLGGKELIFERLKSPENYLLLDLEYQE